VLGVGALTRSGNVPDFSDQDPTFVDIAAPGVGIFSTFPTALTNQQKGCTPQGYTDCASGDYRRPEGTSFAAPQVSAAAALLLGLDPKLASNQVSTLLERNADDVDAASGCPACPAGRDRFSGWGSLDVQKAVAALTSGAPLPPADRFEPNDKVSQAHPLGGRTPTIGATLDYWDDPVDFYRVKLARGQRLETLVRARRAAVAIVVWRQGARHPVSVAKTKGSGKKEHLAFRAAEAGSYYVQLRVRKFGSGRYTLHLSKSG
jgi:hypothetical protein